MAKRLRYVKSHIDLEQLYQLKTIDLVALSKCVMDGLDYTVDKGLRFVFSEAITPVVLLELLGDSFVSVNKCNEEFIVTIVNNNKNSDYLSENLVDALWNAYVSITNN